MTTSAGKLDKLIDELIIKMNGSNNVVIFLECVLDKNVEVNEKISSYITLAVSNHFNISVEDLINEGKRAREAALYRTICYRLHKDVINYSIRRTALIYKRQENAVFMGLKAIGDIQKNPKIDIQFYESFMKIKEHVTRFANVIKENGKTKEEL